MSTTNPTIDPIIDSPTIDLIIDNPTTATTDLIIDNPTTDLIIDEPTTNQGSQLSDLLPPPEQTFASRDLLVDFVR
ncbi:uncharacterized protein N7482_006371 [Penicillium canariense]|uniref:Uncharacterized protein n=1 Tax=Penicillium canariense TaxID=189055 RepID=A0A9W9HUW1_9EURO|nr:uncharacterized protein N7482_006371 [Penicillium canariense]KAJ5159367.1 hypothetical protein N7482_006371 [Penicillium canariense]